MIPVLTIERFDLAVPLARALVAGGARALEVTLRSDAALEAVRRIATDVPEAVVGVGSVRRPDQLEQAVEAGAQFGVSPMLDQELVLSARDMGLAYLPGVATVSEAALAGRLGASELKLFPVVYAGGIDLLEWLGRELPELAFCPTGGLDAQSACSYLDMDNVLCVAGSWPAPPALQAAEDWPRITRAI